MILRFSALSTVPFLLHLASLILADDFGCKPTLEGSRYDFTSLGNGEHVVNRTRTTPPTKTVDAVVFDLCGDLKTKEGLGEEDQCPSGTRACLTQVNLKGDEPERIVSVIPVAQSSKLAPQLSISPNTPRYLTLLFHASEYPQEGSPAQSLNLTLWCDPQLEIPELIFNDYDGSQLKLTYKGIAGCPLKNDTDSDDGNTPPDDGNKGDEPAGSGIGWFFTLFLLAFVAYFAIGAYYNYSTYGARGLDLIPHRDFWQEVPYMLRDVVSHMCSSARPRRSTRGGYISV